MFCLDIAKSFTVSVDHTLIYSSKTALDVLNVPMVSISRTVLKALKDIEAAGQTKLPAAPDIQKIKSHQYKIKITCFVEIVGSDTIPRRYQGNIFLCMYNKINVMQCN